jgi:SAM-dependent methyltransferase
MESRPPDPWTSGDPYNAYVGRWSRLVARELLTWLDIPAERDWLDVGCGTGALTQTIIEHAHPRSVTGVDPSPAFIEFARAQVADERARFEVGDGQALAFSAERFDAAVSGLVLNFVPDPHRAVGEMASYVCDYAGEMQLMRYFWDAAVELDPAAAELDEGKRFPIAEPGPLEDLFAQAGLRDVRTRAIDVETPFADFDDYWSPFEGGQGPAPAYAGALAEDQRAFFAR